MKIVKWQILFGVMLIVTSILLYVVHFAIFKDTRLMMIYFMGNIAFLPVQVFFVTLIVDQLLVAREKKLMLEKMNMVIGTFFCEVGTDLLRAFFSFDKKREGVRDDLIVKTGWSRRDFANALRHLETFHHEVDSRAGNLYELKAFLSKEGDFLLDLLKNPVLLEHDTFTQLLWAIFHVKDELSLRDDFNSLPENDFDHLSNDILRAYKLLISEWLGYMGHLKKDYPYLFSLAVRSNPFDPQAKVIID